MSLPLIEFKQRAVTYLVLLLWFKSRQPAVATVSSDSDVSQNQTFNSRFDREHCNFVTNKWPKYIYDSVCRNVGSQRSI
ncbi:hypothetical protein N7465_003178 [Penicillium sp. CMV-2018d]|nr:hypothetical protein N7465_003178 [Penicillium sp. CMV-2018d]